MGWAGIGSCAWSENMRLGWRGGGLEACRVPLVDETSIRRRHRYVTVVACGESGKVLAMTPGRTKGSLARFFRDQGTWWCRQVGTVVTDGSRSYQAVIIHYLPHATHVLDRFHVTRWFAQGLTLVWLELQRREPNQRQPTIRAGPVPSPVHPATPSRPSHRNPPGPSRPAPRRVSMAAARLGRSPRALCQLYEADNLEGANQALGRFTDLYDSGQIPEYHQVMATLVGWGKEIMAYHTTQRASNGPIEGINNLLQVLRRVAHGSPTTTTAPPEESS